jgi:hypothetical protein
MEMTKVKGICWVAALVVLSMPAFGSANMQFNGLPTGNNYWGVASYPYNLSVDGGANRWMMCIGYNEHIVNGETWKANVVNVGSLDPATHPLDYEAAFLFEMAVADKGAHSDVNAAIWYIFEGAPGLTPGAQSLVTLAQSQTYSEGEFSDVLLYTAIPGTESGNMGVAQMMVGTGVLGLAGALRRKLLS